MDLKNNGGHQGSSFEHIELLFFYRMTFKVAELLQRDTIQKTGGVINPPGNGCNNKPGSLPDMPEGGYGKGKMSIEHTAYHEAGHTVIAYRFGIIHGETNIFSNKNKAGVFRADISKLQDSQKILILLAGDAAQKIYDPNDKTDPSISDHKMVWKLSENMPPEEYISLQSQAKSMVSDNFQQIQAIAEAVLETKIIGQYLGKFIIDAVDNGENWRKTEAWICHKEWQQ